MGEVRRWMFRIQDKTQLISSLLRVKKARVFEKKMELTEKSPGRQRREAVRKEPDHSSLAPISAQSPCLQASAKWTLGVARKHTAGVTHEPGRTDKDPDSQHFVTNTST